jgi:hypothetical protein
MQTQDTGFKDPAAELVLGLHAIHEKAMITPVESVEDTFL